MKEIILGVIALAVAISTADARIGETEAQLSQRYGTELQKGLVTDGWSAMACLYHFNGFAIIAMTEDGKCESEAIKKLDGSQMDSREIDALLKANSHDSMWPPPQEIRDGVMSYELGGMKAFYDPRIQLLTITTSDFAKRLFDRQQTDDEKKVSGF